MWPIESLFFTVGIIIAVIGFTRGHPKESGVTLVLLTLIFVLTFLEDRLFGVLGRVIGPLSETTQADPNNFFYLLLFWSLFIGVVYASYAGNVLDLNPNRVAPPLGTLFDILIGMINGYLVTGMLWYYLDRFRYPVPSIIQLPLTAEANELIAYLPPNFFPSPFLWILPLVLVLFLKIAG